MVMVELCIYLEGWGGIRIEDMIVLGNVPGRCNLSTASKMLLLES